MARFIALYIAPADVMDVWMQTPVEERAAQETKMKSDWDAWMAENGSAITETAGAGKTKRVSADGVADVRNDIMLYSIVESESHEEAAALFAGHPHFQIPGASIEVMTANVLPGMS